MDESSERDRGADPGPEEATDTVGLGRVVEDHRPAAEHPATDRVPGTEDERRGGVGGQLPGQRRAAVHIRVGRLTDGRQLPSQRLKMMAPLWPPSPMLFDSA